jgi:hypothetical protein
MLPGGSCSREGIDGTSPERERPGGPSVVRTGDAGPHPLWRLPLAIVAALVVLGPLAWSLALARASLRRLAISSLAARIVLGGSGVLAALLVPIALARAIPGALAPWRHAWGLELRTRLVGRASLATLGPIFALVVTTACFVRLRRAGRDRLAQVALSGGAWIVAVAGPLLVAAMLVTREVNDSAHEELVYLVRDARLDLGWFFFVRMLASFLWVALAVGYALFVRAWARVHRA